MLATSIDLLIFTSHPIQYEAPLFRLLGDRFGLKVQVVFASPPTNQPRLDPGFGMPVQWDILLTDGYDWITLPRTVKTGWVGLMQQVSIFFSLHRKAGAPPIWIACGWGHPLSILIWAGALIRKIPVLIFGDTTPLSNQMSRRRWISRPIVRILARRTNALLYAGKLNRDFYRSLGAVDDQLFRCPRSIDNDRFRTAWLSMIPNRELYLRNLQLDPARPTLLFCGKLIPMKRPLFLLRSVHAAGLADQVNLIVVGSGALRNEMEEEVKTLGLSHVRFLGFLNQTEVPLAYVLGELLSLSSARETWGLVVNEAMACGRPVVVTSTCGCAVDLVEGRGTGWVAPPDDIAGMASILRQAARQYSEWPTMGKQANQLVTSEYSFDRMAEGIVRARNYVLNHRRSKYSI
jgi:glycosyltransferase involved in cell wall biosynthesis